MRKRSLIAAVAAALTGVTIAASATEAKGRHYHTVLSSHHVKLQACIDARDVMYLHYDARHSKNGALVSYLTGATPGHLTSGRGQFGAIGRRSGYGGGASVGAVVRFRLKFTGVKRPAVKILTDAAIGRC